MAAGSSSVGLVLLKIAGGVAIVAAATAAAILLNLTLLDSAQPGNDPVGKLSPRAVFVPAREPHRFTDITEDLTALVFFGPAEGSRA